MLLPRCIEENEQLGIWNGKQANKHVHEYVNTFFSIVVSEKPFSSFFSLSQSEKGCKHAVCDTGTPTTKCHQISHTPKVK